MESKNVIRLVKKIVTMVDVRIFPISNVSAISASPEVTVALIAAVIFIQLAKQELEFAMNVLIIPMENIVRNVRLGVTETERVVFHVIATDMETLLKDIATQKQENAFASTTLKETIATNARKIIMVNQRTEDFVF